MKCGVGVCDGISVVRRGGSEVHEHTCAKARAQHSTFWLAGWLGGIFLHLTWDGRRVVVLSLWVLHWSGEWTGDSPRTLDLRPLPVLLLSPPSFAHWLCSGLLRTALSPMQHHAVDCPNHCCRRWSKCEGWPEVGHCCRRRCCRVVVREWYACDSCLSRCLCWVPPSAQLHCVLAHPTVFELHTSQPYA
jgi:hypothetical protein